jgi:transposase-like protein
MNTLPAINPYKRHRFPAEIISHCVWLYYRFSLSYHEVEELMADRGVTLSHEAVRCTHMAKASFTSVGN